MKQGLLARVMRAQRLPVQAAFAGLVAGTFATAVQMLLWVFSATPVFETLLRDARLTAAIVMGRKVLAEESGWRLDVLAIATLIHFGISFIYAAMALPIAGRLPAGIALLAGGLYGLAIYVVNLHGFTSIFPWFAVSRGWATILAHVAFGVSLLWICRSFDSSRNAASAMRQRLPGE